MRNITLVFCFLFSHTALAQVAEHGTLLHDGVEREHYLFVPQDADETTPLFVALHGLGGNAKNLRFGIGLTKRAQGDGFAVVYPQGIRLSQGSRHWNAGFSFSTIDDLGCLDRLIAQIYVKHGLNKNRLTIFGISNGGYMAYRMACHLIHAITTIAGTMSPTDWSDCPVPNPVSVLHIHGIEDPMIHFTGVAEGMSGWGGAPAVPLLAAHWAAKQNALPTPTLTNYKTLTEARCMNTTTGTEVQMLALVGFGHDWPNLSNGLINALDYVMKFVERTNKIDYRQTTN